MAPTSTSEIEIEPVTAAEEQPEIENRGIDASDAEAAIVGGEEAADIAGAEGGEAGGEDEDEGEGDVDGDGDGDGEEDEDEEGGEGEGEEEAAAEEPKTTKNKTTKKRVKGEKKEKRGKKAPKIGLDKQFEAAFKANKDALDGKRKADLESRAARGAARAARATAA